MNKSLILTVVLLVLSACLPSIAEFNVLSDLPPETPTEPLRIGYAEKIEIGYQYKYLKNNQPGKSTLTSISNKGLTWINNNNCIYTTLVQFAAPCLWKNCAPFDDGTSKTIFHGSIWPLYVGKKFSVSADFGDFQQTRNCSVESAHKVESILGISNALKVFCADNSNTLIWFLSIPDGRTILHEHSNSLYGFTNLYETTD